MSEIDIISRHLTSDAGWMVTNADRVMVDRLTISVATNEIYHDDADPDVEVHSGSDPSAPASTQPKETNVPLFEKKKTKPRAIFVDWMRSIAVYGVVIVHIFVHPPRHRCDP